MPSTDTPTVTPTSVRLTAGDNVTLDQPAHRDQIFVITRVKQTNALIQRKDQPDSPILDCPLALLTPTGERSALPAVTPHPTPASANLCEGALVRINRHFGGYTPEDLMVVVRVNATTVTLHRLGGTDARGMRAPVSGVTVVDLASILA